MDRDPIRLEELEANLDRIHEAARDTVRRLWQIAEANGMEPSDFVKGVSHALSNASMQIMYGSRPRPKSDM